MYTCIEISTHRYNVNFYMSLKYNHTTIMPFFSEILTNSFCLLFWLFSLKISHKMQYRLLDVAGMLQIIKSRKKLSLTSKWFLYKELVMLSQILCYDMNMKCPPQAHVLSPANGTILGRLSNIRRWDLAAGSRS
jgi:hypothetical protein